MNAPGVRAQMHRAGGNPFTELAVGGNYPDVMLGSIWYPAGVWNAKSFNGLNYSASAGQENFLVAVPHFFPRRAGTITKVAAHHASATGRLFGAIYRADATTYLPTTRVLSVELVSTGFHTAITSTLATPLITSPGEILWFATVINANAASGGLLNYGAESLYPVFGTNYDAADSAGPPKTFQMGYREAYAYAALPASFAATGKLLSGAFCPALMFQWAAT